jgi:heme-degrading monooxygenase HmoA
MPQTGQPYTSGDWVARPGQEDAFITEWEAFAEWSFENAPGVESAVLIRDSRDPRHFLSFGAWADTDAVNSWRASTEFQERLGRCRALCESFEAHDYTAAAILGG